MIQLGIARQSFQAYPCPSLQRNQLPQKLITETARLGQIYRLISYYRLGARQQVLIPARAVITNPSHRRGSFLSRCLLQFFVMMYIADLTFTLYGLKTGLLAEENPLIRALLNHGLAAAVVFKLGLRPRSLLLSLSALG